jgi:8-oxo-dGTP pyrophosphatase MutT (NUDIX family)
MDISEKEISERLRLSLKIKEGSSTSNLTWKSDNYQYRCAAVLIPLLRNEDAWHLLFTHRTELVESHKGQVSFPGGACESMETKAEQTATREAEEEIGLRAEDVRILGILNEVVTITQYRVTPVVGVIPWPYHFNPAPIEVSRVFFVPLDWVSNKENWDEEIHHTGSDASGISIIRYHVYDRETIWGVTAQITHNFLSALGLIKKTGHR